MSVRIEYSCPVSEDHGDPRAAGKVGAAVARSPNRKQDQEGPRDVARGFLHSCVRSKLKCPVFVAHDLSGFEINQP
jgi:hypothetical protein